MLSIIEGSYLRPSGWYDISGVSINQLFPSKILLIRQRILRTVIEQVSMKKVKPMYRRKVTCPFNQCLFIIPICIDQRKEHLYLTGRTFCKTKFTCASTSKRKGILAWMLTLRTCIYINKLWILET